MQEAIARYFTAEKNWCLVLAIFGLLALAFCVFLFRTNFRAAVIPIGLVAFMQLGIGGGVYLRTDKQVDELRSTLERSPRKVQNIELPRMQKVMKSFISIEYIEIALIAAGIGLAFLFKERTGVFAVGLGLILQASLMLLFDLIAENRGAEYVAALKRLAS